MKYKKEKINLFKGHGTYPNAVFIGNTLDENPSWLVAGKLAIYKT